MSAITLPTGTVLADGLRIRYADSGTDGPIILVRVALARMGGQAGPARNARP